MNDTTLSTKELKLTAAVYASHQGVVAYLRETGKLPETIDTGRSPIAANIIIRERGVDITLSDEERLLYDAILRENRLPGGSVRLVSKHLESEAADQQA